MGEWSREEVTPTDTLSLDEVFTMSVTESGTYLAGYGRNGHPTLWKNGTTTTLNKDVSGGATGIAVSGTDVHISYSAFKDGTYRAWYNKNGQNILLDSIYYSSKAQAICVSGPDVYVGGSVFDSAAGNEVAVYWKNGNLVILSPPHTGGSILTGITVSGNDVYASGLDYISGLARAVYWKNGDKHLLNDGTNSVSTSGIAVSGNDVYVCGMENYTPTYWKNSLPHRLASRLLPLITSLQESLL